MTRIDEEKRTIVQMIELYCRKKHNNKELCNECKELKEYALKRLDRYRYGENKTFCNKCPTHCYKKDKKEQIKKVMRYSGPRMVFHNPVLVIKHLVIVVIANITDNLKDRGKTPSVLPLSLYLTN